MSRRTISTHISCQFDICIIIVIHPRGVDFDFFFHFHLSFYVEMYNMKYFSRIVCKWKMPIFHQTSTKPLFFFLYSIVNVMTFSWHILFELEIYHTAIHKALTTRTSRSYILLSWLNWIFYTPQTKMWIYFIS